MCGRYAFVTTPEAMVLLALFLEKIIEDRRKREMISAWKPHYNLSPTQAVPVLHNTPHGPEFTFMRWDLIPAWFKGDPKKRRPLFNARSETIDEKPSFRGAYRYRRCVVPATGFYEWRRDDKGKKGAEPYFITRTDGQPMLFAAVYDTWLGADGSDVDGVAIVTTEPNAELSEIHHRCPVILDPDFVMDWMSPGDGKGDMGPPPDWLPDLMRPPADGVLAIRRVGAAVNKAAADGPELMEEVEDRPPEPDQLSLI